MTDQPAFTKENMESFSSNNGGMYAEEFEQQDFRETIQPIMRHLRMVIAVIILVILSVFVFTMLSKPVYQTAALLEINKNQGDSAMSLENLFNGGLGMGMEEDLYNEAEIIKSRSVLRESIERNGGRLILDKSRPVLFQIFGKLNGISDRIFGKEIGTPAITENHPLYVKLVQATEIQDPLEYKLHITGEESCEVTYKGETIAQGKIGEPIKTPYFSFTVSGGAPSDVGQTYPLTLIPTEDAIKDLSVNLEIEPVRNTRLIKIKLNSIHPDSTPERLQSLIDAYQNFKIERKTGTATQALKFINEQLKTVDQQMQQAVGALKSFKEEENVLLLSENVRMITDKIIELERSRNELNMMRNQAALLYKSVQSQQPLDKDSLFALGNVLGQPLLIGLAEDLSKIQSERAALRSQYTEQHPQIQALDQKMTNLKEKIKAESLSLMTSLDSRQTVLDREIKTAEQSLKNFPEVEKRLAELTRQAKVFEETYSFLLEKKGELEVTRAGQIDDSWLVVAPYVLPSKVKPKVTKNMALSIVFGLFLAVGFAFMQSYFDNTVKNSKDITDLTNLPVLGSIASHPISQNGHGPRYYLITEDKPNSHVSEAFRTIRTNLLFTGIDNGRKAIVCTSGMNAEGKTTVSTNIALSLAQTGKKVLLLDADLRKPMVYRSLKLKRQPGLTKVLLEEDWKEELQKVIQKVENENLDVLVCGDVPPNPNEMLSSEKMNMLLNHLKNEYDFVVIDTPPTLIVSDALVLSKSVDGVLLVTRSNSTDRNNLKSAIKVIRQANGKILGAIVNDVDFKKEQYYYKQYGKYYYGRYYSNNYQTNRRSKFE